MRKAPIAAIAVLGLLLLVPNATAATRFAAPGGNGADPCLATAPCSIFTAASSRLNLPGSTVRPGDVVVLAPGTYSDTAGDLGPQGEVELEEGIIVRGDAGQPRPLIRLDSNQARGAMEVRANDFVSHIEIATTVSQKNLLVRANGVVQDFIARSSTPNAIVCTHISGFILDSACISSGFQGVAIGTTIGINSTVLTAGLRNVTAVSTGSSSTGLGYQVFGDSDLNLDAKGVIAEGRGTDVLAAGRNLNPNGRGANVRIDLDHSAYATVKTETDATGGTATVTPAGGFGTNITAPPLLAADGFHQLPGSPTVDAGTLDLFSPPTDIDGEPRNQGAAPDIGADERDKFRTTTTVSCAPARARLNEDATCTAVVVDPSTPPGSPAGTVQFDSDSQGTFPDGGCDLEPRGSGQAGCTATYVPTEEGAHRITATYPGAAGSDPSQATDLLAVGLRRFAAPGGDGEDPCMDPSEPCTIFKAAARNAPFTTVLPGDEVVLAPGEYSDTAGDLGPDGSVVLQEGITLRGEAGEPRPVIELDSDQAGAGAMTIEDGHVVSHLEIVSDVAPTNVTMTGGTLEDFVGRSSAFGAIVCRQTGGLIRNSACLSSGEFGTAIGDLFAAPSTAVFTTRLRNVTAVSTGRPSDGMRYNLSTDSELEVDAKAVIVKGTVRDVVAEALSQPPHEPGTGAEVRIDLDHSAYATVRTLTDDGDGVASVTQPTTSGNVNARPLLAADGIHQLPGSPTVDKGATDDLSSATDIDGETRVFSAAADIGADERLAFATATAVECMPASILLGRTVSCVATVDGDPADPDRPTGTVELSSNRAGEFSTGKTCVLGAAGPAASSCTFVYKPGEPSPDHGVTASYLGEDTREPSKGSTSIAVSAVLTIVDPLQPVPPPQTTLGKRPRKKTVQRSAKFTFSSDQRSSRFECKLDKRPFGPCRSPFARKVKPGAHTFRVRAVNRDGAADPTPAVFSWKVLG